METKKPRKISVIAYEIYNDWGANISNYARPYLNAMMRLHDMDDKYHLDSASYVITYFLANAYSWRGENARRIKNELKDMLSR